MSDSDHAHDKHFSPERIFGFLALFTALEVAWGLAGKHFGWNRPMLWGGLLFFAFLKGWLIAVYFMHLKFEGWVVKSLILPTPFLVMVIFGYVMPDVANHEAPHVHPIGSAVDPDTGAVVEDMEALWEMPGHGGEHDASGGAGAGH
jgi:caa(3)-type oxidase subunit IV